MDEEVKQHYIKAGAVIQDARELARELAEPGTNLKVIADEIEDFIRSEGVTPAFPVNLSVNDQAAHYTPGPTENRELKANDVVKIDIGAQSNGYIADTALTVNPSGSNQKLIDAVEKMLEKGLEFIEPGKTVGEFGTFMENQIPKEYNVIRNLTGHYLDQHTQHAGVSIPNGANDNPHEFKVGDAFAIEPFLTTGSGFVRNGAEGNIYLMETSRSVRGRTERQLMKQIKQFNGLPFTTRWLNKYNARSKMAMQKLVQQDIVHSYPILNEESGGMVAQAEHTVILTDGGKIITTRR